MNLRSSFPVVAVATLFTVPAAVASVAANTVATVTSQAVVNATAKVLAQGAK